MFTQNNISEKIILMILFVIISSTLLIAKDILNTKIYPLAQNQNDNLHPNFNESDIFHSQVINHWITWDVGTSTSKNVYIKYQINDSLWSIPMAITSDTILNQNPQIEIFNDSLLIVWESNKQNNFNIRYCFFDVKNYKIITSKFITEDTLDNRNPVLQIFEEVEDYFAMLVWERNNKILWSLFNGDYWSNPEIISTGLDIDKNPSMKAYFSLPFIAWEGFYNNNWDIYCSWFIPDSSKWVTPVRSTNHPEEDRMPAVSSSDVSYYRPTGYTSAYANLVWQTNRDGNWEIYKGKFYSVEEPPLCCVENLSIDDSSDTHPATRCTFDIDVFFPITLWNSNRFGVNGIFSDDYYHFPEGIVIADSFNNVNPVYSSGFEYWLSWESYRNGHWEIWGTKASGITDIVNPRKITIPNEFRLSQNYPNPFNSSTVISYELSNSAYVKLEIFNIRGQRVKILIDEFRLKGNHHIIWDGKNNFNTFVPSGVYFYILNIGKEKQIKKALLIR